LTEEEKKITAQTRSVAATLYDKVDLTKPTVEFLREPFYKDPTLALAYFYCCSTDPCVAIFNDKLQPEFNGSVMWNLGCTFWFLFRFWGDRNLEQDSGSDPDSGGIRSEHTLMFQLFKWPEP
jgi:hypothetical protein